MGRAEPLLPALRLPMPQYFDIKPTQVQQTLAEEPKLAPRQEIISALASTAMASPVPKHPRRLHTWSGLCLLVGLPMLVFVLLSQSPSGAPAASALPAGVVSSSSQGSPKAVTASKADRRLSIPSLGVDAAIQTVGLTREGNMAVPSNNTDVNWLKQGPWPGNPGNAVLDGHLNGGPNVPAVFQNLQKLKPGDYVYVIDKGKQLRFKVTGSQAYYDSQAPLDKIFGGTSGSHLNLITCSGNWDKTKKDYNKRLVVFSELAP